jgi:hypothetical protein
MSANDMTARANMAGAAEQGEAAALLGEFSALLRALGSPSVEISVRPAQFLAAYQTNVLGPIELPAVVRAHQHASRGEFRELLELDAQLAAEPLLQPFAEGSWRVGRMQLERLRPLRDERLIQRYLAAVEAGRARGWHTVVYGIILAIYSWPLRQSLIHYGRETMSGLAGASRADDALEGDALRLAADRAIANSTGAYSTSIASP